MLEREKHKIKGESLNLEKNIFSHRNFNVQYKVRAKSTTNKMCHLHSDLPALQIQEERIYV